jgi:Ni,Fe-hydrogenase III small subunit/ferredoxin
MPWIPRGLRDGIVTTRYPRRPDGYGIDFQGTIAVLGAQSNSRDLQEAAGQCPTNAITVTPKDVQLDRGRCILCGRCVGLAPGVFQFDPSFENSVLHRTQLVVPDADPNDVLLGQIREKLAARTRALRRSIHIRHVDAGSDGAEEWEVAALTNPIYDVQRLGIYFTASPRHADILLATGVGSAGMLTPLRHTYDVMPEPKIVIAAGVDAVSGGLIGEGYAARGGVSGTLPVDVYVPGSPPTPFGLLHGILLAVGLLQSDQGSRVQLDSRTTQRPFSLEDSSTEVD